MGFSFKRVFANPAKTVSDIATGGLTLALRSLPKKMGGGESGIFAKSSEVVGATTIGAGTGAATGFIMGGPGGAIAGAVVGGASGFGRGVSGVVHNESGRNIAAGSSKWGAITGGAVGTAAGVSSGSGAAGFVKTAIVKGATTTPKAALTKAGGGKLLGWAGATTAASSLISALKPIAGDYLNVAPPANPSQATSTPMAGETVSPNYTPSSSPTVLALPTEAGVQAPERGFPWIYLAIAALAAFVLLKKKAAR